MADEAMRLLAQQSELVAALAADLTGTLEGLATDIDAGVPLDAERLRGSAKEFQEAASVIAAVAGLLHQASEED